PSSFLLQDLPSFPTRRSSDLTHSRVVLILCRHQAAGQAGRGPPGGPGGAVLVPPLMAPLLRSAVEDLHLTIKQDLPDGRRRFVSDRKSTRLNSSHVSISYAVF